MSAFVPSIRHRFLCAVVMLALASCLISATTRAQTEPIAGTQVETIGVGEIERGMRGYGVSVFAGTEAARFDVEVVGVLENLNPGLSFIMANLSGQNLEETGVIAGMSGSPVYIEGRLAGAIAFSWSFSRGALAGITPIAAMRDLGALPGSSPAATLGVSGSDELERVLAGDLGALLDRNQSRADLERWFSAPFGALPRVGGSGTSGGLQLLTVGFDQGIRDLFASAWGGEAWRGAGGASAGKADPSRALPDLEAGSPVSALLVSGDLQMAVNGTVTERRGNEILAFGHPYLGLGSVGLPMAKAEIVTIVSSRVSSFKLSNVGEVVGAFDEDRSVGMRGMVGAVARTTPMSVTVRHPLQGVHRYDMQLADLEPMRPMLIAAPVLQSIGSATRSSGKASIDFEARFEMDGRDDLVIEQSFDGGSAVIDAAIYLLQVAAYLELNPQVDVSVTGITVQVDQGDEIRTATIEDVFADRRAAYAGDQIELRLQLRDYRGSVRTESVRVQLAQDLHPGPHYLFVGDGNSVDAARLRIEPQTPRTFDQTLAQLSSFYTTKDLVILGVSADRGVISERGALPSLPGSLREVWQSSNSGQVKGVGLSILSEQVERRSRPLSGLARVDIEVLPAKRP